MKRSKTFVWLSLVAALFGSQAAAQNTQIKEAPLPRLEVEKHTLSNGLDVLMVEDHRLPRVAVDLWYHVGPANEEAGRTGFAHLFEHMMFQKSKHIPEDAYFKLLESAGGSDMNGTTDFDRTNYFETVPSNEIELALWLESDRMGYLLDALDAAALKNQQDVVRNERRQSVENQPYGIVEEAVFHNLFPREHPYFASVIGSHSDIQAATLDNVRQFFKEYYRPNNASVAIVGDIDKAKTLKLVEKYFGSLKRGPAVPPIRVKVPSITSEKRLTVTDHVQLPRLYMAWITPSIYQRGDAEATMTASILGQGRTSRLYRSLVYEKQIAQDVNVQQDSYTLGSVFMIRATARPGHSPEEMEKAINEELEKLKAARPSSKELQIAKAALESRTILSLEQIGSFNGIADRINKYNQHVKNPNYLHDDMERYRRVTAEAVQQFAGKFLTTTSRVVVYGVPGEPDLGPPVPTPAAAVSDGKTESVNADEPWRSERPVPGPAPQLKTPSLQTFKLDNGLSVFLDERKGIPVVSASLVVRTGSGSNPTDKPGLASLAVDMLNNGTTSRPALQFADELASIGAQLRIRDDIEASALTLVAMKNTVDTGFDLLSDAVRNPAFAPDEIDRQRQNRIARLVQAQQNANNIANDALMQALYGAKSPYGYTELGTVSSVRAITPDEVRDFWARHIVPSNAGLIVSGDISAAELRRVLEKSLGLWKGNGAVPAEPPRATPTASRLIIVDKPGAPQTQLRVAIAAPSRSTPDYEPLQIMNAILGGPFSSRINMNLREEHGYTYGANSRIVHLRNDGWFVVSSGVRTDVTAPAVREVLRELVRITETPVANDELALAKERFVSALPARFNTTEQTVGALADIYLYDLGNDYYSRFVSNVKTVTIDAVQQMARKYLVAGKFVVIAVGDRRRIEDELRKLSLDPVEIRDAQTAN